MPALRTRRWALTGYLERLLDALVPDATLLTPRDPASRGAQLSVRVRQAAARHEGAGRPRVWRSTSASRTSSGSRRRPCIARTTTRGVRPRPWRPPPAEPRAAAQRAKVVCNMMVNVDNPSVGAWCLMKLEGAIEIAASPADTGRSSTRGPGRLRARRRRGPPAGSPDLRGCGAPRSGPSTAASVPRGPHGGALPRCPERRCRGHRLDDPEPRPDPRRGGGRGPRHGRLPADHGRRYHQGPPRDHRRHGPAGDRRGHDRRGHALPARPVESGQPAAS